MNDEQDPLIPRLRAGLDAATDGIDSDPPGLGDVTATPRAGHKRAWLTAVAAAALVGLTAAGIFVATLDSEDSPELAPLDSRTVVAGTPDGSVPPTVGGDDQIYRATATVLESQDHGPQLCLGVILDSYPPQCGGLDITNWDWRALASERANETRWGEYVVVGTYDREAATFTLTQPARDAASGDYTQGGADVDFTTPCEEPDGGWPAASESELQAAAEQIQSLRAAVDTTGSNGPNDAIKGFGGLWFSRNPFVLNVRIKGELEAADARIRKFYGGPMCLVPSARTLADLQRIQDEINVEWQDEMSSTGQDIVASQIDVELFVPNPELEQELADRYRDAVSVTVTGLIPISPGEDPDPGPGSVPPTPAPVPSDTAVPSRYPGRVEAAVTVSER